MFALISRNADACIFYDKTNQTIDSLGLEGDGALVCKLCGILQQLCKNTRGMQLVG